MIDAYQTEARFWFADLDVIYVRYVSNDLQYGGDLSLWPPNFSKYASAYMGTQLCLRMTNAASKLQMVQGIMEDRLKVARATDAMEDATRFPPRGSWVRARNRQWGGRDGGRW